MSCKTCKGKTKTGKKCKNKCKSGVRCYRHKGGDSATPFKSTNRTLSFKRRSPPKKAVKPKYIPPHLRNKGKGKKKEPSLFKRPSPPKSKKPTSPKFRKGRFTRPTPEKKCVDYQKECKKSKYGNVYDERCHPKNQVRYNVGLKNQAHLCANLRVKNRRCRIEKGLKATPHHDHAIRRTRNNAEECSDIIELQTRPQKRTNFRVRNIKRSRSDEKFYRGRRW